MQLICIANTIIVHNDKVVVDQPSIAAIEKLTENLWLLRKRMQMEGKTHEDIQTVRPLRDGEKRFSCSRTDDSRYDKDDYKRKTLSPALRIVVCILRKHRGRNARSCDSAEHAGGRKLL